MQRVIIESPLSGNFKRNIRYARLCMLDCLRRGEAPFASHLLYTQVWDDADDQQRQAGIMAGHEWYNGADAGAVYDDLPRSVGMNAGIKAAAALDVPVHYRRLPPDLMARLDDGTDLEATEGAA